VTKDSNENIKIKCPALSKEFSQKKFPQVLRKLINDATNYLGQEVTQAVITVPAYFNDSQRQATMDAEKLQVLRFYELLMNQLQLLAYGLDNKMKQY
jgi:molecular chaperone DnaK